MADFRLRIGFAKTGPALWLSHLEVVRAMERCLRRSGVPCAISGGFSPHLKHSFCSALPVGTGSTNEYLDVALTELVNPEEALRCLQAAQHEHLPIQSAVFVPKNEPSLQVFYNLSTYLIAFEDEHGALAAELLKRFESTKEVEVEKKGKLKRYELALYLESCHLKNNDAGVSTICLSMISRPEGSLRPEILLNAITGSDLNLKIASLTRIGLEHREL